MSHKMTSNRFIQLLNEYYVYHIQSFNNGLLSILYCLAYITIECLKICVYLLIPCPDFCLERLSRPALVTQV